MIRDETGTQAALEAAPFEVFFEQEYASVAKALFLLVGNRGEAEDLAEDAFARAWARWDTVGVMTSPAGYVYRTALNLHRNRLRRLALEFRHRGQAEAPEDPASGAETRDQIRRALRAVPLPQREALLLVEWLGLSYEEAGMVLGVKPVSVRARCHRARTTIRATFGGDDE